MVIKLFALLGLMLGAVVFSLGLWLFKHDFMNRNVLFDTKVQAAVDFAIIFLVAGAGFGLMMFGAKHLF